MLSVHATLPKACLLPGARAMEAFMHIKATGPLVWVGAVIFSPLKLESIQRCIFAMEPQVYLYSRSDENCDIVVHN